MSSVIFASRGSLEEQREDPRPEKQAYGSYGDSINPPPGHADRNRAPSTETPSQIEGSAISAGRKGGRVVSSHVRPASPLPLLSHAGQIRRIKNCCPLYRSPWEKSPNVRTCRAGSPPGLNAYSANDTKSSASAIATDDSSTAS